MKTSQSTMRNLQRDKNVLGKEWKNTYKGFFNDNENFNLFITSALPFIPQKKPLRIIYVASANGELGEKLAQNLKRKKRAVQLTLIDASKKHLNQNKNKRTRKIKGDLLNIKIREKFDLIIMRSSLDYFQNKKLQIRILRKIRNWLTKDGIFINQPAALATKKERDAADKAYSSSKKIGKRHFQCDEDIRYIYSKAGLSLKKINKGARLVLTEKEHVERYKIKEKDILKIREIIRNAKTRNLIITKKGYKMVFIFPIYLSRAKG